MFTTAIRTRWMVATILCVTLSSLTFSPAIAQLKEVLSELFKPSVPRAIERGLAPGGDLAHELTQVTDVEITTLTQARAIIKLAKTFPRPAGTPRPETEAYQSALASLATLYSNVSNDSPAINLILEQGIPELVRIYDAQVEWSRSEPAIKGDASNTTSSQLDASQQETLKQDMEDLVDVLGVLAMYCTPEGTDRVMHAIERKIAEEHYAWGNVFAMYTNDNPQTERFLAWISTHLPDGPLGQSLLANSNRFADEQVTYRHPFNNARGAELIKGWLADQDEYEVWGAIMAIPFLDAQYRIELFEQTEHFTNKKLRLEVAWARAKVDDEVGFKQLEEFCLDVHYSVAAQRYLEEFKSSDRIPEAAFEPDFAVRAEMSEWLSDGSELGSPPDELAIIDKRELKWFDTEEPILFNIVKYLLKSEDPLADDQRGVGLVGSMTMSFMEPDMLNYLPEDIYAMHYGWEAESSELITSVDRDRSAEDDQAFNKQWQFFAEPLEDAEVLEELKLAPTLEYPGEKIVLAKAKRQGEPGIAVLDGERSRFYSNAEFGSEISSWKISKIHIGRTKLGFDLDVTRTYKPFPEYQPSPQLVLDTYQQLFDKLTSKTTTVVDLDDALTRIAMHHQLYVDALASSRGLSHEAAVKQTFEKVWKLYHTLPKEQQLTAFDELELIGQMIVEYAVAIGSQPDRQAHMSEILTELETRWDSNLGRALLAKAALAVGLEETAVRLFEKQIELKMPNQHTGELPHVLASAWQRQGKTAEAKSLLVKSLQDCLKEIQGSSPEEPLDELQSQVDRLKETYRKLFPESADADLQAAIAPVSDK